MKVTRYIALEFVCFLLLSVTSKIINNITIKHFEINLDFFFFDNDYVNDSRES